MMFSKENQLPIWFEILPGALCMLCCFTLPTILMTNRPLFLVDPCLPSSYTGLVFILLNLPGSFFFFSFSLQITKIRGIIASSWRVSCRTSRRWLEIMTEGKQKADSRLFEWWEVSDISAVLSECEITLGSNQRGQTFCDHYKLLVALISLVLKHFINSFWWSTGPNTPIKDFML